jgi:hypothetical protein
MMLKNHGRVTLLVYQTYSEVCEPVEDIALSDIFKVRKLEMRNSNLLVFSFRHPKTYFKRCELINLVGKLKRHQSSAGDIAAAAAECKFPAKRVEKFGLCTF